jgi:hypothetical protein
VLLLYDNLMIFLDLLLGEDGLGAWGLGFVRAGRFAVRAFVAPLLALSAFEMGYSVNKRRATRFYFRIKFDTLAGSGVTLRSDKEKLDRMQSRGCRPGPVRYTVWIVCFLVSVVVVIANSRYIVDPTLSTRASSRFSSRSVFSAHYESFDVDAFADVVPLGLCIVFLLYVGVTFWVYGTYYSTDVSAHLVNRWSSLTLAVVALLLAWFLSPRAWHLPYAVNAGEVLVLGALIMTMHLIDKNLRTLEDWNAHLTGPVKRTVITSLPKRFMAHTQPPSAAAASAAAANKAGAAPAGRRPPPPPPGRHFQSDVEEGGNGGGEVVTTGSGRVSPVRAARPIPESEVELAQLQNQDHRHPQQQPSYRPMPQTSSSHQLPPTSAPAATGASFRGFANGASAGIGGAGAGGGGGGLLHHPPSSMPPTPASVAAAPAPVALQPPSIGAAIATAQAVARFQALSRGRGRGRGVGGTVARVPSFAPPALPPSHVPVVPGAAGRMPQTYEHA